MSDELAAEARTAHLKSRSVDPKYGHTIVREYPHWTLLVNENQHFLGRCVIWLVREGRMQRESQLSDDELLERRHIEQEVESALESLWSPDHINYAWLGNLFHEHGGHGHTHLIPRYKHPPLFNGKLYPDGHWNANYPVAPKLILRGPELIAVRDAIIGAMPS